MSAIFTCLEGRVFQIEPAFIVEKCVEKVVEKEVIKEVVKEVEVIKEKCCCGDGGHQHHHHHHHHGGCGCHSCRCHCGCGGPPGDCYHKPKDLKLEVDVKVKDC
ncbi:hypothetical protein IWW55_001814 [Coemansia sp. RSA 2706]|nr:hypothetical protein IWW55_001814 [Coemansia sp. RSA 2706]KAJ2329849.1 hypothetical protein IWW51_000343 [Coemansia sp. RSA 2702]KAJ2364496.1 hypothetical protein H4S01_003754 [Coemansia sp. RSA 2610]KAJ2388871.1 hypothetical protein H4S02_002653 [Coemansia sp. RSA 2611]